MAKKSANNRSIDDGVGGRQAVAAANKLLHLGVAGVGPLPSAQETAARALEKAGGDKDAATKAIIATHRKLAAAEGFATGVGGFFTLAAAVPANIAGFYLVAAHMSASIAALNGYDNQREEVQTAVLLTLVGVDADDVLAKAGVRRTPLSSVATERLPGPAVMVINKAIGFRLLGRLGGQAFSMLGRAVPLAGGAFGGAMDVYLLNQIAKNATSGFPSQDRAALEAAPKRKLLGWRRS
ncbi:EcsC family protein [Branchiibius sp. NY16-3462-2]|uniref:EcsC family protein n=1 Tax=Branchiibius sp. NY16-3462-2 TaxID=1807500 RepID=UPI00079310E7|nr:EcsC family protein [Branchiibius sp. NY16-3462-2]KYH43946.1 hypothetical protein AZH51_04135 [Branchiibius sp. NY16-3462-2]